MKHPISRYKALKNQVVELIQDGLSPERIALAITLACCFALIPLPFTNTLLLFVLAVILRLNHVMVQTINYILFPFQVLLYLPFYKLGTLITGIHSSGNGVNFIQISSLKDAAALGGEFFLAALIAWAVIMIVLGPLMYLAIIKLLHPSQQRFARFQHLYLAAGRKMRIALSGILRNFREDD